MTRCNATAVKSSRTYLRGRSGCERLLHHLLLQTARHFVLAGEAYLSCPLCISPNRNSRGYSSYLPCAMIAVYRQHPEAVIARRVWPDRCRGGRKGDYRQNPVWAPEKHSAEAIVNGRWRRDAHFAVCVCSPPSHNPPALSRPTGSAFSRAPTPAGDARATSTNFASTATRVRLFPTPFRATNPKVSTARRW